MVITDAIETNHGIQIAVLWSRLKIILFDDLVNLGSGKHHGRTHTCIGSKPMCNFYQILQPTICGQYPQTSLARFFKLSKEIELLSTNKRLRGAKVAFTIFAASGKKS